MVPMPPFVNRRRSSCVSEARAAAASARRCSTRWRAARASRGHVVLRAPRRRGRRGVRAARRRGRRPARGACPSCGCATAALPEPSLPDGWRLRSWVGRCAATELVESYARARAAIDDAPTPGGCQPRRRSTSRGCGAMEETAVARGRESRVTVAIDEHGEVGAFTDIRVSRRAVGGRHDRRHGRCAARARARARYGGQGRVAAPPARRAPGRRGRRARMNAEHNVAMRAVNTSGRIRAHRHRSTTAVLTL